MRLIDQKFRDVNGRKHKLYKVRSLGAGRGFGVIRLISNEVVMQGSNRKQCYDFLRMDRGVAD